MKYYKIGDYLKFEIMEKFEVNQNMLAVALGVEQNRISEIVRGRRRITPNTDLRLCKYFGFKDGYFLDLQKNIELEQEHKNLGNELNKIIPLKTLKK